MNRKEASLGMANERRSIAREVHCLVCVLLMGHLTGAALARPRTPLPPWPERGFLASFRFDNPNLLNDPKAGLLFQDVALAESWSGYALSLEGPAPKRFVIPAVDGTGKTNLPSTAGTIRFWFKPSWSSISMGGDGPSAYLQ
jgi:hypothetical protein